MQNQFKGFTDQITVQLLVICMTTFATIGFHGSHGIFEASFFPVAHAESSDQSLPSGWESYLDRPDILKIQAQAKNFGKFWESVKAAHFSFVAELLALYPPDTHLYFLARDSEHLYDVARLVTQGTAESQRMHLLNVSRANMRDQNLKGYLKENGISEETLTAGRKVLFIDTGFSGTIPRVIGENFSADSRRKLKTQLVVSSNPQHPSSRAFLIHLNPSVNEQSPSSMHGSIVSYEYMTRYTDRSSQYVFSNGQYHPVSPIGKSTDGNVSKERSLRYMEDLKAEWQKPETRARFQAEIMQFKEIKHLLSESTESAQMELKAELEKRKNSPEGRLLEAQIRDILEAQTNADLKVSVKPEELGLKQIIPPSGPGQKSKKDQLITEYPEWAPFLENPDDKIPELFQGKNWQLIGNLIDANVDAEINRLLAKSLFDAPATGIKKDLQVLMIEKSDDSILQSLARNAFSKPYTKDMNDLVRLIIEKGDDTTLKYLAQFTFSQPHTKDMKDLLKFLIEKADSLTLASLAQFTFSQPHTKDMKDLLRLLIESGDAKILQNLARYTFSQPHTKDMKDLLRLLIEKGNNPTLASLAEFTFSQPHTKDMKDLLRLLIESGDATILQDLARYTFSQPHTKDMKDLLRLLIEKGNNLTLANLTEFTFSQPHTKDMKDLLRLLIEKADSHTSQYLAYFTFSQPHTEDMKDLLRLLIEKADARTLQYLAHNALSKPHAQTPEHQILRESLKLADPVQRKTWIEDELIKINSPLAQSKNSIQAKPISLSLQTGDVIVIENRHLKVVKKAGEGRRGVVFQVQSDNGTLYALKTAKDSGPATLAFLAQESSKAKQWEMLKIPHSKVLVQEKDYVLKTWVEGRGGDEVIEKYAAGDESYKAAAESLLGLVEKIRSQGAYVGDFRPANMVWTGKAWVIVDSGSIEQGMTQEEAQAHWSRTVDRGPKFERGWRMQLPAVKPPSCKGIFGKLG
jgi:hypothetical protein